MGSGFHHGPRCWRGDSRRQERPASDPLPARAAAPGVPDPSHSPGPGTEPPAHHRGAAQGAPGHPTPGSLPLPRLAQEHRVGAEQSCLCLLPPGLGQARVTDACRALPHSCARVGWAGHGAWHARLHKGGDDARRRASCRGQGRRPWVCKAVLAPSMGKREPSARPRAPSAHLCWTFGGGHGRLGGRSRLLLKAPGSSVTAGIRRAPGPQASPGSPPQQGRARTPRWVCRQRAWVVSVRRLKLRDKRRRFRRFSRVQLVVFNVCKPGATIAAV